MATSVGKERRSPLQEDFYDRRSRSSASQIALRVVEAFHKALGIRAIFALLTGFTLLLLLFWIEHEISSGGKFLHPAWMLNLLWLFPPLLVLEMARATSFPEDTRGIRIGEFIPELTLFGFMFLFLFSGAVKHRWFYFICWTHNPELGTLYLGPVMIQFVLMMTLVCPFMLSKRRNYCTWMFAILVFSQVICLYMLLSRTGGEALYRDDHPSFMFRLWGFAKTFPRLRNYDPYWNGGLVEPVAIASGTPSLGILLWPVWRFVPIEKVYTYVIGFVFVVFIPWLAVASLRIMGRDMTTSFCGGTMATGISQYFFLWLLNYGTICANFTLALILPVCACVYRVIWLNRMEKWLAVTLVASGFFLMLWPLGTIVAGAVLLSVLVSSCRLSKRKFAFLSVCAIVIALLHLPTLAVLMTHGSANIVYALRFSNTQSGNISVHQIFESALEGFKHLLAHLLQGHPLLVFLGIGGVLIVHDRHIRRWCWPIVVALAIIAGWGKDYFPKLQLSRMAIPLFFIAIVPASITVARLFELRHYRTAMVKSALIALLLLGGWNIGRVYANKGPASYVTLGRYIGELTTWIHENVPADGRILFAGSTVHYYGRGHVALLPYLTEREMMACDYYHFPTETVDYEYPPRPFRESVAGTLKFMDLYNVTHIITFHDSWHSFFSSQTNQYELLLPPAPGREYCIFGVKRPSSMFLKGNGTIKADFNMLSIFVEAPEKDAVLKYNWTDGLSAPAPVELYPFETENDVRLIGVRPNGCHEFNIRYTRWL